MLCISSGVEAAATPWQANPHGQVRLICADDEVPKTGSLFLGFHFKTAPGWYVYWKVAGDAGYPPKVAWKGSKGFKNPQFLWPQPKRFILPGNIVEYGYEDEVVYPVRAELDAAGATVKISATVSYLTCNTSCVPYQYAFTLNLPVEQLLKDAHAQALIEKYLARVPSKELSDTDIQRSTPTKPFHESFPWWTILFAFLGGVILNVMPCVLPVLSIKLFGLLQQGGQNGGGIFRYAMASALGIIVSFLGLAGVAIFLRQAGHAIGWGIQFQNPWFVGILMIVVFLFAFNLWGFFEIGMPRIFGHFATTFGRGETLTAHFVSGLFATLLATPCSAPFLGSAMGFALTQPAGVILATFAAAGTGMALPYFVLAIFPGSLGWLPRPGVWMIRIKAWLGVFLAATGIWLGWVLFQQLKGVRPPVAVAVGSDPSLSWQPFDEAAIQKHIKGGRPVFVDVTADWCVTCKYNERFVLSDPDVVAEFKKRDVVMMRADWTNQDPAIGRYLMSSGRAGIPFYALYYPYRDPVLLSEFLTKKQVLREMRVWDALQ